MERLTAPPDLGRRAGQAKVAKGHNPAARYLIHTVGPIWNRGEADSGIHRLSGQFSGKFTLAKTIALGHKTGVGICQSQATGR